MRKIPEPQELSAEARHALINTVAALPQGTPARVAAELRRHGLVSPALNVISGRGLSARNLCLEAALTEMDS